MFARGTETGDLSPVSRVEIDSLDEEHPARAITTVRAIETRAALEEHLIRKIY
jgi:hypothetical protein